MSDYREHDEPEPNDAPPKPIRNKGPLLTAAKPKTDRRWSPERRAAASRAAKERTNTIRTAEDVPVHQPFQMAREDTIRMPRDTGEWSPDYDGPGDRMSRLDRDTNQFELPKNLRSKLRLAGWDTSWHVIKVLLADVTEVDGTEIRAAFNAGWRPAKAKDFPELCVPGTNPNATIEQYGQRLFIRPMHLTLQAQREDEQAAHAQMQSRIQATQEGRLVRGDEEGLADSKLVRPVHIGLEIEGESGTHAGRR